MTYALGVYTAVSLINLQKYKIEKAEEAANLVNHEVISSSQGSLITESASSQASSGYVTKLQNLELSNMYKCLSRE